MVSLCGKTEDSYPSEGDSNSPPTTNKFLMLAWCKKNHKREVQSIDDYFCDNRVRNLCHSEHGIHGVYKS